MLDGFGLFPPLPKVQNWLQRNSLKKTYIFVVCENYNVKQFVRKFFSLFFLGFVTQYFVDIFMPQIVKLQKIWSRINSGNVWFFCANILHPNKTIVYFYNYVWYERTIL